MVPTSFLIKFGNLKKSGSDTAAVFKDRTCVLLIKSENSNHISSLIHKDGFTIFIGERLANTSDYQKNAAGTLITYRSSEEMLEIFSDHLGTCPLYYSKNGDCFSLSNRTDNLSLENNIVDWQNIYHYLCKGYTLNDNTFFENIRQTCPRETITVTRKNSHEIYSVEHIRRSLPTYPLQMPRASDIAAAGAALKARLSIMPESVIMMSAGWDSRTLLIEGSNIYTSAYSHGDLSSREIRIAGMITGQSHLDHTFSEISRCEFLPDLLDEMLDTIGHCLFPIWFISAKKIQKLYDAPLTSGVLGELMGGHYGLTSIGNRKQKIASALSILSGKFQSISSQESIVKGFAASPEQFWFFDDDTNLSFQKFGNKAEHAIFEQLTRYFDESSSWDLAIEQFQMEHRARQYILKQSHASAAFTGYCLPFADAALVESLYRIPFNSRMHNKINKELIRKHACHLLNFPMSATLVNANFPIAIQELSRGVRILIENALKTFSKPKPKLGWFNYDHLYENGNLHEVVESLKSNLWCKQKMHAVIKENPNKNIDAGSTLDMLTKIKTIDYHITKSIKT